MEGTSPTSLPVIALIPSSLSFSLSLFLCLFPCLLSCAHPLLSLPIPLASSPPLLWRAPSSHPQSRASSTPTEGSGWQPAHSPPSPLPSVSQPSRLQRRSAAIAQHAPCRPHSPICSTCSFLREERESARGASAEDYSVTLAHRRLWPQRQSTQPQREQVCERKGAKAKRAACAARRKQQQEKEREREEKRNRQRRDSGDRAFA